MNETTVDAREEFDSERSVRITSAQSAFREETSLIVAIL